MTCGDTIFTKQSNIAQKIQILFDAGLGKLKVLRHCTMYV